MASEEAVKYFRYKEQQAFLKWKRMCVRSRERQALKELADVDMPDWKKRKLVREVAYYAGCSEFQPLRELDVYEYETEAEPMSDAASYSFSSEDSAIGATEAYGESTTSQSSKMEETQEETPVGTVYAAIRKPSISRSSEQMESSTAEPVNENTHQSATSQFSKMEETQPVVSVYAAICKPSISRSSEHTESSTAEPNSETTLTTSRFSEQVESSLMESVNETARKSTASQISGQVDSTAAESISEELNEDDFETFEEWTISTQNSPERPRRSDDCNSEIANLSPKLAALNIKPETSKGSDARECIEEFAKNPKVRFFKRGKLHKHLKNRFSYETIYRGECSNELLTTSESPDAAAEESPSITLLVPNNVQSAVQQLVLQFAERFDCRVVECDASRGSFDERVSHVVVDLDLEAAEPLQFVHCQAIGCKRHLVEADWLRASLKEDRIAPLDPYEIFFDDSSVAVPSRVARLSSNDLFDGFAIVMCKPFVNFDASMMERLLIMNGARVCEHPRQLIDSPEQARLCAVDPQFYREGQNREQLKLKSTMYKFVAVHYAWLFNCFFMYRVQPLLQYLHDATPEEAAEVGVPDSLLED